MNGGRNKLHEEKQLKRKVTISSAKKKADKWFSIYIRLRDSDWQGYARCITTGQKKHWKELDCGHFQTRQHLMTRWNELNCNAQSKMANGPLGGMQYEHGLAIDRRYGKGTADQMVALARTTRKFTIGDILDIADKYKEKALIEAKKRGIEL